MECYGLGKHWRYVFLVGCEGAVFCGGVWEGPGCEEYEERAVGACSKFTRKKTLKVLCKAS